MLGSMKNTLVATDYPNLYRSKESEIFYARIDTGRKTVKKSLKTRVLTEALSRLAGFLAEQGKDELPVESVSWYLAVDMYVHGAALADKGVAPGSLEQLAAT